MTMFMVRGGPFGTVRANRKALVNSRNSLRTQKWKRDTAYWVYAGIVLVVLTVGPLLWSLVSSLQQYALATSSGEVLAAAGVVSGIAVASTALCPSYVGPAWTSLQELAFFIDGPFGVFTTLARRTSLVFCGFAVLAMVAAGCLAIAVSGCVQTTIAIVVVGCCMGVLACLSLLGNQSPRAKVNRAFYAIVGLTIAVLAILVKAVGVTGGTQWGLTCAAALVLVWACVDARRVLRSIKSKDLLRDTQRRNVVFEGLSVGDSRAAELQAPTRPRPLRFAQWIPSMRLAFRVMQTDVLIILRRPLHNVCSFVVFVAAGALIVGFGSSPWVLLLVLYALQFSLGSLMRGLRDYSDHVSSDRVDRAPFLPKLLCHLIVPSMSMLAGLLAGGLLIGVRVAVDGHALTVLLGVFVVALVTRFWSLNGGSAPSWIMAPMLTPSGDMSPIVLVLWILRSFLPGLVFVFLANQSEVTRSLVVVGVLVAAFAGWRVLRMASHHKASGLRRSPAGQSSPT